MAETYSLLRLCRFLHETLILTEDAKNVLITNCEEATFSLKPWSMEVVSQQEINRDACICPKPLSEIDEITAGIGRTLLQAQQLRKRLSSNVIAEKKSSSSRLYECYLGKDNKERRNVKAVGGQDRGSVGKEGQRKNVDKETKEDLKNRNVDGRVEKIKSTDNRSTTHMVKSKQSKNFLAINKRSLKNVAEKRRQTSKNEEVESNKNSNFVAKASFVQAKCIKFAEKHSAASLSELQNLIQKVSCKSISSSTSMGHNVKCPLHGNNTSLHVYKHSVVNMNVMDSLNHTNIPGEIIRPLKIYHSYLNNEYSGQNNEERLQKGIQKFLKEFHEMDKSVKEKLGKNPNAILFFKTLPLLYPLFSINFNVSNLVEIKKMYEELNPIHETNEIKELDNEEISKIDSTEWMKNGIWNSGYPKNFKGMSEAFCIRYSMENRLLHCFDLIQQLQYTQYHKNLIKIMVESVIPYMENTSNSTQSEYVKLYKMIFVLSQGLSSKVPVLVKTDKE